MSDKECWETPKIIKPKMGSRIIPGIEVKLLSMDTPVAGVADKLNSSSDRQKQIRTELDVMKLKDQVEQLTQLVHRKSYPHNESTTSTASSVDLERENTILREKLERTEFKLTDLQNGIVHLQSEYHDETLLLQQQTENLMKTIQEEKLEKAKIKKDHEKMAKALTVLKDYLKELPSSDEFLEIKALVKAKENTITNLLEENDRNQLLISNLKSDKDELTKVNTELTFTNQEMAVKLSIAEDSLNAFMKRQEEALKFIDEKNIDFVASQNSILKENNDRMKKYISVLKLRHKKDLDSKNKELTEKNLQVSNYTTELKAVNENAIKNREQIEILSEMVKSEKEKFKTLQMKSNIVEREFIDSQNKNSVNEELESHIKTLVFELGHCLHELKCLNTLTNQVVNGEDPNVSILLGVTEYSVSSPNFDSDDKITTLHRQLECIKKLKKEIKEMRNVISDKYADNLGNNMTSCITQ